MKILALEFSADLRSAAVLAGSPVPACAGENAPREHGPLTLIERALKEAGVEREAIDTIAVGLGPGSYAGIRSAIAVAQGWQLGRKVRLVGMSSVEVLAAQAQAAGVRGPVNFVVDAQRGEVYWARYVIAASGCEPVQPLRLAGWADLATVVAQGELLMGPSAGMVERGVKPLMPGASALAVLAAGCDVDMAPETLEPIYLRATSFIKAAPARWIPPVKRD
jgi:tRNA threonylcarbamoyladenosine biosynthesis protein TsaB